MLRNAVVAEFAIFAVLHVVILFFQFIHRHFCIACHNGTWPDVLLC